jgi:GT2 family glycosyltransferase/glycosyltransferase involved in cell wall biosynthesis
MNPTALTRNTAAANAAALNQAEDALAQSMRGFFDPDWYTARYPDILAAGLEPLRHFMLHGAAEHRDPNAFFDSAWYARQYPDVAASGVVPLLHYLSSGAVELRNPHPRFDAVWYADQYPDSIANPLVHYMRIGRHKGHATERVFDVREWLPSAEAIARAPETLSVDVVIPVYRGFAETKACLDSVLADPFRPPGRIIVIDDASPDRRIAALLDRLARARRIELLRNPVNRGFVASANLGLAASRAPADVTLLNSDTEVPPGWLHRLGARAWAHPKLATVSPLSNNATICSYPRDRGWGRPFGLATNDLDQLCQNVNAGRSIDVPTTVGFCMYIRRDALAQVGPLDEKTFGRGYGEEVDFCRRAIAMGWRHRLACDIYVHHAGSVSFGDEAGPRAAAGQKSLESRYPDYARAIATHVRNDRVAPMRFVLTTAVFRRSRLPVILLICHDLGGGVRRHIDLLVERFAERAHFLLLGASDRGASLSVPAIPGHAVLRVPADRVGDLIQVLRLAAVSRVHVHHLAGVDLDVRDLIHRLDLGFDVTVHDYFAICPQVTFLPRNDGAYCGEPGPAICADCIAARPSHGAREILAWRKQHAWPFLEADRVLCPSEDTRARLARYGLADRAIVAPHEPVSDQPWVVRPRRIGRDRPRIAILGVLASHKGAHVVAALARQAHALGLEFILIGHTEADFPADALPLLNATGKYDDADLPFLLKEIDPHVVWFPAPWPETYSYTLSAALRAELPVVATAIGSLPERLANRPLTWLVPPSQDPAGWAELFRTVVETLRKPRPGVTLARRPGTEDFYAGAYLTPPSARPARVSFRRPGHKSVVVIPERIGDGLLSPCAYIRLLLPLDHPAIGDEFNVMLADATTATRYDADLFITQRYAIPDTEAAEALITHVRASGARLVYDLDDDLLNIPLDHADAATLRPKSGVVRRMINGADQITVSTQVLRDRLRSARDDLVLVPNGLDERLWLANPPRPRRRFGPVRILYMGTQTHAADLALIAPALGRVKRDFGHTVEIEILGVSARGDLPDGVTRIGPSVNGGLSYPGFVNWFTQAEPWDIGLAPLVDTAFNRSKSVIKCLDYAALGLAVLASDMPVYRGSLADGPGGQLVADSEDAWYNAISWLIRDRAARLRLGEGARAALQQDGTLAAQAVSRRALWETAFANTPPRGQRRRVSGVAKRISAPLA